MRTTDNLIAMSPETIKGSWSTGSQPILINAYESGYKISLHFPTMQKVNSNYEPIAISAKPTTLFLRHCYHVPQAPQTKTKNITSFPKLAALFPVLLITIFTSIHLIF